MGPFTHITGFDWDQGNLDKNLEKHEVSKAGCEEVFFNVPLVVRPDVTHTGTESRYYALGMTDEGRPLFIAYTLRKEKLRVISARDMSRRELEVYRDRFKKHPKVQK